MFLALWDSLAEDQKHQPNSMSIFILQGLPGNGKTLMGAQEFISVLKRNIIWDQKGVTKRRRVVATNVKINEQLKQAFNDYIVEWDGLEELVKLRGADVFFDDMGTILDAQRWADVPEEVKRWFRWHEHYGCTIYGNCQEFKDLSNVVRKLTVSLKHVSKIVGSSRPHETLPEVKHIWGLMLVRPMKIDTSEKPFEQRQYEHWFTWRLKRIRKKYCEVYDTTQDMKILNYPPMVHIERFCEKEDCKDRFGNRTMHVKHI